MVPAAAPFWFYTAKAAIAAVMSASWYRGLALPFSHGIVRRLFARAKTGVMAIMG